MAHAKKLYGFDNNEPRYVTTNQSQTLTVSVFDRDALVTPGLPLRWELDGSLARPFRPKHAGCLYFTVDKGSGRVPR